MKVFYIGAFGLMGIFVRYFVGQLAARYYATVFPCATFAINIVGSFVIGVVYVSGVEKSLLSLELRVGIMVGLLGGFTTFSAYSLETMNLLEQSKFGLAAFYFVLSPVLGLLAACAGATIARHLLSGV